MRTAACSLSLFRFFHLLLGMIGLKPITNIKNEGRKPWLFATYIEVMDLLWRSINGSKRPDDFPNVEKLPCLIFQYIMKRKHTS